MKNVQRDLVFCVDERYLGLVPIALGSILENLKSRLRLNVWVVTDCCKKAVDEIFCKLIEVYSFKYNVVGLDLDDFGDFELGEHITKYTYARLYLCKILPKSVEKVLYLDPDLIAVDDITDLLLMTLDDMVIGAVENPIFTPRIDLGILEGEKYFNAGVLLIDLEKWRMRDIDEKVSQVFERDKANLVYWDQDVLNLVFKGEWKILEEIWNLQTSYFENNARVLRIKNNKKSSIMRDAKIVHFSTSSKPWHYENNHPLKSTFKKFQLAYHVGELFPEKIDFKKRLKKALNLFIPFSMRGWLKRL